MDSSQREARDIAGVEMKILGRIAWACVALAAGAIAWMAVVAVIDAKGREAARTYAANLDFRTNPGTAAVILTGRVFETYTAEGADASKPFLLRIRPFLSHAYLPEILRVAPGAIEAIYLNGHCDAAARSLAYVLSANGMPAEQINLIGAAGQAHSIVQATLPDGETILLDPHTGLAPFHDGRAIGAELAKSLQTNGIPADDIWKPIVGTAKFHPIYDRFPEISLTPQGAAFDWRVTLDLGERERLQLGVIDGSSAGTSDAAAAEGLGVYWDYVGHRYDRGWTRILTATQPVTITFHLVDDPRPGVITSVREPQIEDRKLIYSLAEGEALRFRDRLATPSLLTLRSYIEVDAITIERTSND
jgi:hypothetical protein